MHSGSALKPGQLSEDFAPWLIEKEHEDLAGMVEYHLRQKFNRANIWVISSSSFSGQTHSPIRQPAIWVLDGDAVYDLVPDPEDKDIIDAARAISVDVYGNDGVYVRGDELSIMPEGDGLKYILDQLLKLRYGHVDYRVELFRTGKTRDVEVSITDIISDIDDDDDAGEFVEKVPGDVCDYVLKTAREMRPDIVFRLAPEVTVTQYRPRFSRGFVPL